MPTHSYWCNYCKTEKQRKSSFDDIREMIPCPHCGKPMKKQLFASSIIYRGSGFSKTDVKKPYDPFDKDELDKGMERTVK